jgi:hypothetical protein
VVDQLNGSSSQSPIKSTCLGGVHPIYQEVVIV